MVMGLAMMMTVCIGDYIMMHTVCIVITPLSPLHSCIGQGTTLVVSFCNFGFVCIQCLKFLLVNIIQFWLKYYIFCFLCIIFIIFIFFSYNLLLSLEELISRGLSVSLAISCWTIQGQQIHPHHINDKIWNIPIRILNLDDGQIGSMYLIWKIRSDIQSRIWPYISLLLRYTWAAAQQFLNQGKEKLLLTYWIQNLNRFQPKKLKNSSTCHLLLSFL